MDAWLRSEDYKSKYLGETYFNGWFAFKVFNNKLDVVLNLVK